MTKRNHALRRDLVLLVFASLLFLACATAAVTMASLSPEEQNRIQTRDFGLPDSVLFSAVLRALADRGYAIQFADKSNGIIQTEFINGTAKDIITEPLADAKLQNRYRMMALVKNGTVKLNYTFESNTQATGCCAAGIPSAGWETPQLDTSFSNRLYRQDFSLIEANLHR